MPLQTFYNLIEDRKREILKIAYEEFAFNSYLSASLSTIIKKLGVAKGSFYRYFENKFDLYSYLIQNAYEMRMNQLGNLLNDKDLSFFEIIRENFRDKIIFDLQNPLESMFLYSALQESNEEETGTVVKDMIKSVLKFVTQLIQKYQQKGELSDSVSPEVAAHFIFQTQLGIYEYLAAFKGIDFKESIKNGRLFSLSEKEIMKVVDEMLTIIKSGLKAK
ncbi:TetR/AcrR family transcriptional regulator [Maribellus maritimus]|uniref:TetR/AcrR family transcriptional regulator n=1 Tax=Maribellus maritimus TaxID=2870838 RepID=UPI001EEC0776|nr:TetR/AcrR family transcriptional regulator [Maribellus maritimus]MCG6189681.1 TetR/AcrR family transcriptional regulator [Maribellus maritimus]